MIRIGLTSFNEHSSLTGKKSSSLYEYAGYLPLVELDTNYYGIATKNAVENWLTQVPANFRFVVKLYAGFTGQSKWQDSYPSVAAMQTHFLEAMQPMIESGKLFCFLAQFPAQFKCTKENVAYLETLRGLFKDLPVAIELRDYSWYAKEFVAKTHQLMRTLNFSLVMVDEPQLPDTVPLDSTITNNKFSLFRFHGRNQAYWNDRTGDWRKKRTLYRYNPAELHSLGEQVLKVSASSAEVGVIFNNNSGGDAADNAMQLKKILQLDYEGLNPSQIDLF
ncbi:DUF72 domain-containing protein [Enterococcus xiangfangensis]|uniref:DUF72 domain-containing protein n=1 Tax=Enterococcus xiangfangensis TaxID=1296537 RepID=UPI0010F58C81|nr:DUF72 domain-containing protein [Enterococcus xiangfangensis]MBM7712970.1 uncharacterized protein YecE (DUF72 family) [Enterococcus xiangfangensis]NBK09692.1 DUF72 domain-containing protein [Enterococcus asini]